MSSDKVYAMMIMRWRNVQTIEYDLQAKTYPPILIFDNWVVYLHCFILFYQLLLYRFSQRH